MGVDWNNGVPPIENWTDVEACIKEIPCPGVSVQEDGTEIYAPTERIYTLWQYGSTTGFKNVGVDQVAESMRFKYGFCNPMPETQILAAATFGDPETRQIDNLGNLCAIFIFHMIPHVRCEQITNRKLIISSFL